MPTANAKKSATKPKAPPQEPTSRRKSGPPPLMTANPATLNTLRGLGQIQAIRREVAQVFGVDYDTLGRFFKAHPEALEAYEKGKGEGKISLRRTQFKLATTNASMAIWLGEQYLGQAHAVEAPAAPGMSGMAAETRIALADMKPEERAVLLSLLSKVLVPAPRDPKLIEGKAEEAKE